MLAMHRVLTEGFPRSLLSSALVHGSTGLHPHAVWRGCIYNLEFLEKKHHQFHIVVEKTEGFVEFMFFKRKMRLSYETSAIVKGIVVWVSIQKIHHQHEPPTHQWQSSQKQIYPAELSRRIEIQE